MTTRLILVGGFLGAGKTTLLWLAAQKLTKQGRAVGLITNDQASDLVDTAILTQSGVLVREVSGSCFCCNFSGFMDAVQSLVAQDVDVIIAEPVGSCTDLSATILQPIKDRYPEISLAPLTVLADPERTREALRTAASHMHDSALYILRKQMEEADSILLNKTDTMTAEERAAMLDTLHTVFPDASVHDISARTGDGVGAWLTSMLTAGQAGQRIASVDYDIYAEGEAVLGWLNGVISLFSDNASISWVACAQNILSTLQAAFQHLDAEIGHVKLILAANGQSCTGNLTRLGGEVSIHADAPVTGRSASLTLNARVQTRPEILEAIVRDVINSVERDGVSATVTSLRCLMPGRPNPTHRYTDVV